MLSRDTTVTSRQEAAKQRRLVRDCRAKITKQTSAEFVGKLDPRIRAMKGSIVTGDDGQQKAKVTMFRYRDTLAVAALVRKGVLGAQAAAVVDNDYAFVAKVGENFTFPREGNWDPCELLKLADGSQWALFMDDTPIVPFDEYDCWALRPNGEPVEIADYDPTKKLEAVCEYHHAVKGRS